MDSIYLIASEDNFLIENKIKELIKKSKNSEVVKYDLKEVSIDKVIEDLDTVNFFTESKIVIAENSYFLTSEKPKGVMEQDLKSLEKYLNNPNPSNTLILTCSKLYEKKAIVKLLKKNAKLVNVDIDIYKMIEDNLEDYQMNMDARRTLVNRTLNNFERVLQELEKLKLYKYDDKVITAKDVENLTIKTIDDNIFLLIDSIVEKNKAKAFEIYEDMLLHNEEPTKILILLANRIRLLYQVKILSKTIHKDEEIGKIIGSHPYPVKLARGMIHKFSEDDLLSYLEELAQIDYNIKTGNTYQNIALEKFILTI